MTFNTLSRTFSLDAIGANPEGRALRLHLEGPIVNVPPTANPGPDQVVECQGNRSATVELDASGSSDSDPGDVLSHFQWFEESQGLGNTNRVTRVFALGSHQLDLHVYDRDLGSGMAAHRVDVVDTTPPSLTLSPTDICLWPPNHDFALFRLGREIAFTASDSCDPAAPKVQITGARSTEAVDAAGSGSTAPDVVFGPTAGCVRAERAGPGTERRYTVEVTAVDSSGNKTQRVVTVVVPHDLSGHPNCLRAEGVDDLGAACTQ